MPFHPPRVRADPDPRFDPYRERAGALSHDGEPFGVLHLRFETYWRILGGHLWWRRWSEPREQVDGYIALAHGGFDDFTQDTETIAGELELWSRGLFRYRGLLLTVAWLDDEASRLARGPG
ncbi:hypothetical protein [Actinoplanes sp. NPDC023714]|uniref:hypothetical protein n=1 Tax=Actinoplanes sp. NPDC023714 TaxID=3154322 RepID=UPI0033EB85E2